MSNEIRVTVEQAKIIQPELTKTVEPENEELISRSTDLDFLRFCLSSGIQPAINFLLEEINDWGLESEQIKDMDQLIKKVEEHPDAGYFDSEIGLALGDVLGEMNDKISSLLSSKQSQ